MEGECSPLTRLGHDAVAELPVWLGVSWQPKQKYKKSCLGKQFRVQIEVSQGKQSVSQGGTPGLGPRAGPGWRRDPLPAGCKAHPTSLVLETPTLGEQGLHRRAAWCSSQHVPSESRHVPSGWCKVGVLSLTLAEAPPALTGPSLHMASLGEALKADEGQVIEESTL